MKIDIRLDSKIGICMLNNIIVIQGNQMELMLQMFSFAIT